MALIFSDIPTGSGFSNVFCWKSLNNSFAKIYASYALEYWLDSGLQITFSIITNHICGVGKGNVTCLCLFTGERSMSCLDPVWGICPVQFLPRRKGEGTPC